MVLQEQQDKQQDKQQDRISKANRPRTEGSVADPSGLPQPEGSSRVILDGPGSLNRDDFDPGQTEALLALLNQADLPQPLLDQVRQQLLDLENRIQTQAQLIQQLHQESRTDSLTGLPNRRAYDEKIQAEWRRAMRAGQPLSLISIDVDHFKRYNDRYGHAQGDFCLQEVAEVLSQSVRRAGDLACRVGGEEFMVVLPGATVQTAKALAEKIRLGLSAKALQHEQNEAGQIVTLSMGVAQTLPSPDQTPERLQQTVDQALYRAKQQGRNQISLAEVGADAEAAETTETSKLGEVSTLPQLQQANPQQANPQQANPRQANSSSRGMVNLRATQTGVDRSRSTAAKARWHRLLQYLVCSQQFGPHWDY